MTHTLPKFGHDQSHRSLADILRPLRLDWVYVRYSDDFAVACRTEEQARLARLWAEETLATLHLRLNPSKTIITTFQQGFKYLGCHFKGDTFHFERKGKRIKVAGDGDWKLFYTIGPAGYGDW
jgi:hypothetical protein